MVELSREQTLELLQAIAAFLKTHQALWNAHVVEFFQDRLWENVDKQWWTDLECASVQDLLLLPSGKIQDTWCESLKSFVKSAQSLALFRQPKGDIEKIFPEICKCNISSVLRQGMNAKKLHEVEVLSAVVHQLFMAVHASHIVDVGAGQGYLAQVLAFEYGLPVVALDACAHHADVTNKRSERIKKHYIACSKKKQQDCIHVSGPQTATFHVPSGGNQMELQRFLSDLVPGLPTFRMVQGVQCASRLPERLDATGHSGGGSESLESTRHSFVLAGLHACGDLSAAMLKTYMMCEDVTAVVTVGCCYNLLSESNDDEHTSDSVFGFPLSEGVKSLGLILGRRARDLACQSAERWKDVGVDSALYNFEQHALRAGFQLVLHKYHSVVAKSSPTIGRLGKARRRKQAKRHLSVKAPDNPGAENARNNSDFKVLQIESLSLNKPDLSSKRKRFIEFSCAAFERLGLDCVTEEELQSAWDEIEPKTALIGPYWSLRAVLGPVLETYILLDRLLYLQEQFQSEASQMEPRLVALFNPNMSPRNMAIIAIKN